MKKPTVADPSLCFIAYPDNLDEADIKERIKDADLETEYTEDFLGDLECVMKMMGIEVEG